MSWCSGQSQGFSGLTLVRELVLAAAAFVIIAVVARGADFGDVQLYDEATGTLQIVAHRGVGQQFLDYFANVDASDTSACGLALRAGTRIVVEDVNTHPDHEPHRGIAASTGYRGVQSTPLCDRYTPITNRWRAAGRGDRTGRPRPRASR